MEKMELRKTSEEEQTEIFVLIFFFVLSLVSFSCLVSSFSFIDFFYSSPVPGPRSIYEIAVTIKPINMIRGFENLSIKIPTMGVATI